MIRTIDSSDVRRKIIEDVSKRYDDFIFKQFEKHGFSREDVHKAILEDRLRIVRHTEREGLITADYDDYSIDGVCYFSIFKKCGSDEILIHAIDLKGVKK